MTLQDEIRVQFPRFSKKEKQLATYLLANSDTLTNINISTLAKETNTSPATISRFVKKLNIDSFVDLKIQLRASLSQKVKTSSKTEDHIYNYYLKVIDQTEKITNGQDLKHIVTLIKKAQRIFVLGVGSSGLTAKEFSQRLIRMGLNAMSITDSHMMVIHSSIVQKEDLVFAISASGETPEIVQALQLAKKNKATIISISCFPNSQIAQLSKITLNAYSSSFIGKERFINSQFSIMYQIDVLSTMLLEEKSLHKKMKRTISVILETDEKEE